MSLPVCEADEAITVAIQGDEFRKLYREVVSRVRELPNRLASYNSPEAILETFTADYKTSDDFVFVANIESREEEVFHVHGIISETRLPPVIKGHRVNMGALLQTVKLIGVDDNQDFHAAVIAVSAIYEFLQQSVGSSVQAPYGIQHGTSRDITFVNRLLTPTHSAFPEDIITFPSALDPSESLKPAIDEGRFAFTKDNQVRFHKLVSNDAGDQLHFVNHIQPGVFRPGQIVNVGVSFWLIKAKTSAPMRFISHLDSISLLSWGARKVLDERRFQQIRPKHGLPAKRCPTTVIKNQAKNSTNHPKRQNQGQPSSSQLPMETDKD
ncbi:hypothetical protein IW261DRAFT_1572005 [Armillaria novae-zelandiae]|uniref:Uncharacterized protein n=1 Tax=Armillaria novae-zelandiae TaxID=153914 RepID=A0AA39U0C1_9AGAR|nr:hypothetical protein IW261DRAFT_1572005 [Armillaria novae-zelandiae]